MIRVLLSAPLCLQHPALLSFHMLTGKMGSCPGHALRNIGDRLLRLLIAMLRDRARYDATRNRREPVVLMGKYLTNEG